jgi:hypothetical protein
MRNLAEYLNESYSVNNFKTEINRLAQSLSIRFNTRKQVLINGLIGVMLGAYCLNDKRITELTGEFISKYLELL